MIEFWDPESHEMPEGDGRLYFDLMAETDYLDMEQNQTYALAMEVSNDGKLLVIYGRDQKIRVYNFRSGKLLVSFDETHEYLDSVQESKEVEHRLLQVESSDMERRKLVEKDVMRNWDSTAKES